jgi:hypothetical protein
LTPAVPTADEIVARMIAHDGERQAALHWYSGSRRYVLKNRGIIISEPKCWCG